MFCEIRCLRPSGTTGDGWWCDGESVDRDGVESICCRHYGADGYGYQFATVLDVWDAAEGKKTSRDGVCGGWAGEGKGEDWWDFAVFKTTTSLSVQGNADEERELTAKRQRLCSSDPDAHSSRSDRPAPSIQRKYCRLSTTPCSLRRSSAALSGLRSYVQVSVITSSYLPLRFTTT